MALSLPEDPSSLPIQLISTDFDGTLVGSAEGEEGLPQFFTMISRQREEHQLQWVINTGRSWERLCAELQAREFPILPDWVVLAEREVHKISRDHPVGDYDWNITCQEVHTRLFNSVTPFWKELSEYISSQTGAEAMRDEYSPITIRARNDHEADRIHRFINSRLSSYPALMVMRNSVYFRFAHEAYNKGSGLQRIQAHLEVGAERTLVIGDHYNDLPMLNLACAQYIACPSNSIDEIKTHVVEQGGLVATRPEAAGVMEAWQHFLLPWEKPEL